jgi:enamine deaminase RidA (YjgF/YER057c/UK114 family)
MAPKMSNANSTSWWRGSVPWSAALRVSRLIWRQSICDSTTWIGVSCGLSAVSAFLRQAYFGSPSPKGTTVPVPELASPDLLVQVEVFAAIK